MSCRHWNDDEQDFLLLPSPPHPKTMTLTNDDMERFVRDTKARQVQLLEHMKTLMAQVAALTKTAKDDAGDVPPQRATAERSNPSTTDNLYPGERVTCRMSSS